MSDADEKDAKRTLEPWLAAARVLTSPVTELSQNAMNERIAVALKVAYAAGKQDGATQR